jgi:translation initiation factor IF-1
MRRNVTSQNVTILGHVCGKMNNIIPVRKVTVVEDDHWIELKE